MSVFFLQIILIVSEYKHANPTMLGRQSTVADDDNPNVGTAEGSNGTPVALSPSGALQTEVDAASPDITPNIATADSIDEKETDDSPFNE